MSLAWTTLVVVVLLLPGVLFFVGLFLPEKFTRDVAPRNTLAELGSAVFVAACVHGLLLLVLLPLFSRWLPSPDFRILLGMLHLSGSDAPTLKLVADNFAEYWWAVLIYVLISSVIGTAFGALVGYLIVRGPLRRLAKHAWVYDLIDDRPGNLTFAYVLTTIQDGASVLMYRGFLKAFALTPDGRFSYLVLIKCYRYLMTLRAPSPTTTPESQWREIGGTSGMRSSGSSSISNMLVIEGEDIANVVFDHVRIVALEESLDELESEVAVVTNRGDSEEAREPQPPAVGEAPRPQRGEPASPPT